jgi:hypothetical protein
MAAGEKLSFWLNEKKLSVQVCPRMWRQIDRKAWVVTRHNDYVCDAAVRKGK